ncbi:alpha-amylase family glycosyl hydrolase [Niabella insulamsoli]|uniref:alpha-amylase family glycosyl hydrolase n=1 Tax=Niabella insulamsoli TaxID=3144874 RepID=UPI0031FDB768
MSATREKMEWIHSANIYEVNLRQYTKEGTFDAFAQELPRLKDMGVQVLWLMPITPIATEKMKGTMGSYYACSDYTAVNPEFGTLDDFKNLVNEAHRQGFKLIIDWVANHTGWGHVWTKSNPEYYLHNEDGSFHAASGMDDIIELDFNNPDLRSAMIDAMKFWVTECNIDGFRCDLASWVQVDFWQEARPLVDAIKPLFWLGEFDEIENPEHGKIFDASYSWKWMHKTRDFYDHRQPLHELIELLDQYDAIGNDSMRAWFTTNHDENSWNGTEFEKYGDMAKLLAVFSCTWNGIPLLYSGQELPLVDKRLAFFDKDPIPWTGRYAMHGFYKKLLQLHAEHPALRGGDDKAATIRLQTTADYKILAFLRKNESDEVLVILNWSGDALHFHLTDNRASGIFNELFSGVLNDFDMNKNFEIQPWEYWVFVKA